MGLHTDYLGRVSIEPRLSHGEVEFLRRFNRTRHCGDDGPLDVAAHPDDGDPTGDQNHPAVGMPGLWCPWTACEDGCCLHWDRREKPYAPERWLTYLVDTFLRPGATLADEPRARALGLTFDHVLNGMLVGERRETCELFALHVEDNVVRRRTLLPPLPDVDEWGYAPQDDERAQRTARLAARRARFAAAVEEDRRRVG